MALTTIALLTMILIAPAYAQRDITSNLYSQTVFDWYIAKPEDRMASAVAILAERYMPQTEDDFSKFKRAAAFLIDCINQQIGLSDSLPVAQFVPPCLTRIESDGMLK
ncbi:MAG: hypothetical protein ACFCUR_20455 [Rhodomicrobiaceae bacterium]